MPCYKAGSFIGAALESVGAQTYRRWEVLAVDDGGPVDGTREMVDAFAKKFRDNRVEYIRHELNRGVSVARNTAIRKSRGRYLALLDPDDFWMPKHLQDAVDALEADPGAAVCSSPSVLCYSDAGAAEGAVEFYDNWELELFPFCMAFRNALPTSACVIQRTVLDEVGFFDESPGLQHIEDYDLWLRIAASGHRFALLREASACYRKHSAAVTSDYPRMRGLQQALAVKHMPFLFSLQKAALESLILRFRNVRREVESQKGAIQILATRIQVLEQTNQRIRAYWPIRMLRLLRRWAGPRHSPTRSE